MATITLFVAVLILGFAAGFYALSVRQKSIPEISEVLKLRAYGVIVLSSGYIVHTLGDLLSTYYGEGIELLLESVAHGIILVAFIIFYKTASQAVASSKEYWFK